MPRIVDIREIYGSWVAAYEDTVDDRLDVALLQRLETVRWAEAARVADLACGTGRTGAWLRGQGAGATALHGVDFTPEMLSRARSRGEHDRLVEADVAATGLAADAYDLVVTALVDEHLASLRPLYREARRLGTEGAPFVIVGMHPQFLVAADLPTSFVAADGTDVEVQTHVHLLSEHVDAATAAGYRLVELKEGIVDDAWADAEPRAARWRGTPVSYAAVWR